MLKIMREKAGSLFIKIILFMIVVVFVLWGVGTSRSRQMERAAVVNDKVITADAYRQAYDAMIERYRRFGMKIDDDTLKTIRQQALDQLVDRTLMLQEAEKLGIRVADEELTGAIRKIPVFQSNGVFDKQLYVRLLEANRQTTEGFEAAQREDMIIQKLRDMVMDGVNVSDEETKSWYDWEKASCKVDYAFLNPASYTDIVPSDDEIRAYYESNKESYKTEAMVKVQYARFEPEAYVGKVTIPDEDIKNYYDTNPDEFKEDESVEARHILIKLDKDSTPEQVEEKRKKAEEITTLARAEGADFAELAKQYSEGPTKDRGGNLGSFKRGRMVKAFEDKAFSMKAGEVSDPVQTQFGWHVIKVEKVNPAKTFTLEESTEKIRKTLALEQAKNMAYDDAEALYTSAFEGDALSKAGDTRNIKVVETDFFTKAQGPKDIKNSARFAETAMELPALAISKVQDFGDAYYIIQTIEKKPEEIASFESVAGKVKQDIILKKQDEKAKADADALLAALKEGKTLEESVQAYGTEVRTTDFFERNGPVGDLGYKAQISEAAFKLSEKQPLPEAPVNAGNGYYVIRFKERKLPEAEAFEKEKDAVRDRLLRRKQTSAFETWIAQIKEKSTVVIEAETPAN